MTGAGGALQSQAELAFVHVALQSTDAEAQQMAAFDGQTTQMQREQETLSWAAVAGVMRSAILGTHCITVIISLLTLWIILNKSCSGQPLQSMSQVTRDGTQRGLDELPVINVAERCHHLSRHIR